MSEDEQVNLSQKRSKQSLVALSFLLGTGLSMLSACMDTAQVTHSGNYDDGSLANSVTVDPSQSTCFDSSTTPAIIETVTEQVMLQSASMLSDDIVTPPTAFRTVTRQQIMRERRKVEFEIPCKAIMTPQLIASVQRALIARGYYNGPINGIIDSRTKDAIERFQTAQGYVQTSMLTLQTARILGLVAQPRDVF
ncbi:MAG: hypothetical protein ACI901_000441 [Octadecabacter sp.]